VNTDTEPTATSDEPDPEVQAKELLHGIDTAIDNRNFSRALLRLQALKGVLFTLDRKHKKPEIDKEELEARKRAHAALVALAERRGRP
jgi:hypothetical protein